MNKIPIHLKKPKKVLELFAGTGSFGKVCKERGWDVVSLDNSQIQGNSRPDLLMDIMDWDYKKEYPVGYFDVIWASPPCTAYSSINRIHNQKAKMKTRIDEANKVVMKTLGIIFYFKPKAWFLENPMTGMLKNQDFMEGLKFEDCAYCQYGFKYQKKTRIWTNQKMELKKCVCKQKHEMTIVGMRGLPVSERYKMPLDLLRSVVRQIEW